MLSITMQTERRSENSVTPSDKTAYLKQADWQETLADICQMINEIEILPEVKMRKS